MKKWWNWVLAVALFSLLFIVIPLALSREPTEEEIKPMFDDYVKKFNKSYQNPEEYLVRFQHFVASVREIHQLNGLSRGPESHRAKYGLNYLSDMSKTEFQQLHLSDEKQKKAPELFGKSWSKFKSTKAGQDFYDVDHEDENGHPNHHRNRSCANEPHDNIYIIIRKKRAVLPMKVDWREKGVVGLVRDQGMCGACWAFSTVGTMESMAAIGSGKLETLSVQSVVQCTWYIRNSDRHRDLNVDFVATVIQKCAKAHVKRLHHHVNVEAIQLLDITETEVIDCAGLGNSGCAGGDICLLLDWLSLTNTPVVPEKSYPLKLTDGTCTATKNATGVRVSSYTCDDFVGAEDKIIEALATHGPVTVAVNALTWQHYLGGVIQFHCSGAAKDLNHAVQLVGYDLTAEVPYYIAKNSWGSDFGDAGYLMLGVGGNICGLANEVATVEVV